MLESKEKLLNFRPILVLCANLILGILCTVTKIFSSNLYIFLSCAFFIVNFGLILYFYIKKNKRVYVTLIISVIASTLVCLVFSLKIFNNLSASVIGNLTLNGIVTKVNSITVTDYGYTINTFIKITNGELSGKVVEAIFNTDNLLFEGYKLKFSAFIDSNEFYNNGYFNAVNLRANVNYFCKNAQILSIDKTITNPFYYVKYLLYHRLRSSNALNYEFIFALLTGDTNFVSDITLTRFRDVGVAHIFAVSGLHIGFLYGFVTLILKPVKIKAFIKYIITLIILFLYVIFCGLTPSCLRAFIIIAVSNFARSFGFKNDKLSSVFFSMFIVLSINSSDLFNIGFHLSFVACLSLIFLTPKIEKLLNFILPNKISQFASPYISAYLGTLPIVTDCFSNSTAFSMIFNAVIVPFMSFIFILSFVSSIIILIFSNLLFIMQISSFFVGIIIYIVNTFSFIVLLKITVVFSVSVVFYYFELVLFAGLINLKRKTVKYLYVINFALFLTVFLVINVLHLY